MQYSRKAMPILYINAWTAKILSKKLFYGQYGGKEKMRKTRKLASAVLAASMAVGMTMGTMDAYARSSMRAAWNDASSSKTTGTQVKDACFVEDGSETAEYTAYSNVYADSTEWAAWQETWKTIRSDYEKIALTPGEDATKLNFAWYSVTQETPKIKLMDANGNLIREYTGTQSVENAETVVENEVSVTLYPNKVTVTDLTENTSYQYQYYVDGAWSENYDYKTQSTDSFSVLYVGDPQIGASVGQDSNSKEYHAMNDAYNWAHTLESALGAHKDISFILSAGDQINQTSVSKDTDKLQQQMEYAGFLYSPLLRSIPIATTIGNHDSKSVNYSNHFNNPNTAVTESTTAGKTTAGTDYYFTYGNTLFVSIDTNNYNCATHENVIKEAVEKNPNVTWRVLMFHQDIYGSGYDHSDSDGIILRTQLTPIIDKYDFDAVLQGHDHTYSRTYQLSGDGQSHTAYDSASGSAAVKTEEGFNEYMKQNSCYNILTNIENKNNVIDPEGTVYFEANSSTGSKYYQLIGTQQDYIAARSQSWRPTYSVVEFTETTLTVKTYDAATNEELVADGNTATSYTIVKSVGKEDLEKSIASAEAKLAEVQAAGNYTEESVKVLSDTITAAKSIYNNAEAGLSDVASAVTSLQEAVAGLKVVDNNTDDTQNNGSTDNGTGSQGGNDANAGQSDNSSDNNNSSQGTSTSNKTADSSKSNVQTGDKTVPMVLWFSLGAASLAGLGYITVTEKKKKAAKVEK